MDLNNRKMKNHSTSPVDNKDCIDEIIDNLCQRVCNREILLLEFNKMKRENSAPIISGNFQRNCIQLHRERAVN